MSDCSPTKNEVCGSDGKTYYNDCALRVEACAKGEEITVTNLGPCGRSSADVRKLYFLPLRFGILGALFALLCSTII